jgi:lysozyme
MIKPARSSVAVLTLSAVALVGIIAKEGYTDRAVIPIPGDRPTVGFGSTFNEDGSPVTMQTTITPPKAVRLAVTHIGKDEPQLRKCFGYDAQLYQWEWDAYVRLAHNVGAYNVCKSSIVPKVQRGDYEAACNTILDFKKAVGKDCSVRSNGCYGVWLDRLETNKLCLGEPE